MSRASIIQALLESIFGRQSIGYHRTNQRGMVSLTQKGRPFADVFGGLYGPGIYLTYDINSQQHDRMIQMYGEYVIKARVIIDNFLIFDYDQARKIYGPRYDLADQLEILGWPRREQEENVKLSRIVIPTRYANERRGYTSDIAKEFYNEFLAKNRRKVRGLIFNGRQDGRVIVAYDTHAVTPISYAYMPEKTSRIIFKPVEQYAPETMNPYLPGPAKTSARTHDPRAVWAGFVKKMSQYLDLLRRERNSVPKGIIVIENNTANMMIPAVEHQGFDGDILDFLLERDAKIVFGTGGVLKFQFKRTDTDTGSLNMTVRTGITDSIPHHEFSISNNRLV
jgi:hypothetical protein